MSGFIANIALIGLGKGGSAFLPILLEAKDINIIGIADINPDALGLKLAKDSNIPVTRDFMELLKKNPDIIINATGNDEVAARLSESKSPGSEVIDGKSAKFVWCLLEKKRQAEKEVNELLKETKELYRIGVALTSAHTLEEVLNTLLVETCKTLSTPAGSVALYDEKNELLTLKASHGFSSGFSKVSQWKKRSGAMTDHVLSKKTPTVISNVENHPFIDNDLLIKEGIKSLVAVPLFANSKIVGILYIDDMKPREWPQREVEFLTLLGIQAAYAIEKFRLIEAISEAETYLKNVLDNSADIIMTTDNEGNIVEFNVGASRLLGYSKKEMIGKKVNSLWLKPEERDAVLKKLQKEEFIYNYEARLTAKNERIIDVSLTLSYIKNKAGEVLGTVGISKDITDKKRLEEAIEERSLQLQELNENLEEKVLERTKDLEKANRELERSNKLKSQFISTMSHELRTPLNSILGFSELLAGEAFGPLAEKQKKHVNNIYKSGTHLLHLINNILDIAKVEAGKMELCYESFAIDKSLSEVEMVIKPLILKKKQKLIIKAADNMPLFNADKTKFKQILYNLLSNASKFTPEEGNITVEAEMISNGQLVNAEADQKNDETVSQSLKVIVRDTGIGIKKEDHDRIFSEFEQVDSSFSRKYEGTGLGLALTKKFVELHGGEISVESEEGKGTAFTITIPISEPFKLPEEIELPEYKGEVKYTVDTSKMLKGEAPLILVVEDDPATSEVLTLYLIQEGYRVAHAYDGEEAIKRIKEIQPFAVLLDVMLPGKDGWEVLQEVKSDPELKDIPIIISSVIDNMELGFTLGAADYLLKPVSKSGLLKKLETLSFATKKGRRPVNILCIDDHEEVLELLKSFLEPDGYNVITAESGKKGIEHAVNYKPDLIILDLMMPGIDGFEVARTLKENSATIGIPIIILTAKNLTVEDRMRLAGKVENFLQKSHFSKEELLEHIKDLEITYPRRAGLLDNVSGLFDNRYFQIRLAQEISRGGRYGRSFTIMILDLDNFSEYIRAHGIHRANVCIRKIAEFIKKTLRGSDTAVRYGVDEFAAILSNTLKKSAQLVANRTLSYIEDYPFFGEEVMPQGKVTASIVLISFPNDARTPEELIFKAHKALRKAKAAGGGRLEVYEE